MDIQGGGVNYAEPRKIQGGLGKAIKYHSFIRGGYQSYIQGGIEGIYFFQEGGG
jgi:hypothetical protein